MQDTHATATVHAWNKLPVDRPMPRLSRRRIIGSRFMLSEIILEEGCSVPSHSHENEQMAYVIEGRMKFGIGERGTPDYREIVLGPGEVLHLPSQVPHSAQAIETSRVLDVFSPVSERTGIDQPGS